MPESKKLTSLSIAQNIVVLICDMDVYIMCHGCTNYNDFGLCNDDPNQDVHLMKTGIAQARLTAQVLRDVAYFDDPAVNFNIHIGQIDLDWWLSLPKKKASQISAWCNSQCN